MNLRIPLIAICLASIYFWVSCTILLHSHNSADTHSSCPTEDNSHPHTHESCSICIFIQHHTAPLPESLQQIQPYNQEWEIWPAEKTQLALLPPFILSKNERGPPILSL